MVKPERRKAAFGRLQRQAVTCAPGSGGQEEATFVAGCQARTAERLTFFASALGAAWVSGDDRSDETDPNVADLRPTRTLPTSTTAT